MTIKALYQSSPGRFILTSILYTLIPLTAIGQSYIIMYTTTALTNRNLSIWLWLTLGETIVLFWGSISQSWAYYSLVKLIQKYNHQVRAQIIRHYYYDGQEHKVSAIQNRLITDFKNTDDNYLNRFFNCIQMVGYILFSVGVLLSIHWSLLLMTIVLVALSVYLPKLFEKKMQSAFSNVSDSTKKYLDVIEKWLSGLNVLQRYLAGDKLFDVMDKAANEVELARVKQTKANQELAVMNGLISNVLMLILFAFTAFLITNKLIVFGAIVTVDNLQYYIAMGLRYLGNYRGQMQSTKPVNKQIIKDSNSIKEIKQSDTKTPTGFSIENLKISFPNGESLAFPNFKIKNGEKVLVTGDSGTGKSTLFRLVLGELKPSAGKITYYDEKNQEIKPNLSKIGYIAQNPRLFPATIADNITMFNSKLNQQISQVANEVDLENDIEKFPAGVQQQINLDRLNVSGGQRQKIVLARAKIHESKIILIDEGTSAIDQKATISILKKLLESRATIVFIAHNFSEEMRNMFDREIRLTKTKPSVKKRTV